MADVIAAAAGGAAPVSPPPQEETFMRVVHHSDGRAFITNGVTKRHITEPTIELADLLAVCGQDDFFPMQDYTIDRIPEILTVDRPDSVRVDLAAINRIP
jgi:hypothetical protein